jgi:hypothetical protein
MKKTIITLLAFIFPALLLTGQHSKNDPNYTPVKNVRPDFKSPPAEYGIILWWGWDGPVTDSIIRYDLDRISSMGFRGVMIEAGYGMTAKYLSDDWFKLVRMAVLEAKKRGMKVWIEDEGKYPSGFAGGKFSQERPDLKMQGLVVTEKFNAEGGETISEKLPPYEMSAVAINNNDRSTRVLDVSSGELKWMVPEGNWQIFIAGNRFRSSVTRSVNNPSRGKDTTASLMDYLNPQATRQFLKWTHEEYKKSFGEEFGKTFMGFMGDEPDFAYTPWTPGLLEEFSKRKGYDIKPYLASFFVPQPSEEAKKMKADYWDVWSALFRDSFFSLQAEWCRQNNIEYIVHLNHEDQLPGLVKSSGDYFRNMRNVAVPGVDAIWSQIWMDHVADYPKLASSASHLFGKQRAFTESFAAYTHRPSVLQAKWVLDYQLARGINSIQVMFMSASTSKQSPATANKTFFLSDSFPSVARYLNRATYLLSQGKPAARTGLYFPTRSLWYGDNESNSSLLEVSNMLMENHFDFDFVDEQALDSILIPDNGELVSKSGLCFKTIIVPSISVMSGSSVEKLRQFSASGGNVIFMNGKALLISGQSFRNAEYIHDFSWAHVISPDSSAASALKFLPESDLTTGKPVPQVKYLHRELKDADIYFIFNESNDPVNFTVSLSGRGKAEEWSALTGKTFALAGATKARDRIIAPIPLEGGETKFIVIRH